jgi:peroxiredoxin
MLPDVAMTATDGRVVSLGDYRHRKHLVVILFPDPPVTSGIPLLRSLSSRYAEFQEENAEILAVFPAVPPSPPDPAVPDLCPFPVLEDRDGALSVALPEQRVTGIPRTTVYVADRYGEIFRSFDVAGGNPFPIGEILSWLRFLERLCPE